ncbi:unnamed protein product, partial [marine sediment metagenome]
MSINTEPLRRILELEHKKGYADSAVIGGLDRFLGHWANQAIESITNPQLLSRFHKLHLVSPNYASLSKQQRKQWIDDTLNFLTEVEHVEAEKGGAKLTLMASKPSSVARGHRAMAHQSIDSPITVIKGISSSLATKFNKLGVKTVRNLLYFFPHRHLDYSQRKSISQLTE